jgi:hypothetical protein
MLTLKIFNLPLVFSLKTICPQFCGFESLEKISKTLANFFFEFTILEQKFPKPFVVRKFCPKIKPTDYRLFYK